ncbi:MAG TPA: aminotransferase class I/II-fold pyridoxal phosphate-dependent enzyme [Actinobacteria bacterium]|nr:aminotransferase class I/II-fold pyridoxal phosphate-dependent enzyme [Actinomycetota bacterium]
MEMMKAADRRAAAGGDVLHLEVGQPTTPAPSGVLAAARAALGDDRLGYTAALGIPELRERIARWYRERYGVVVPASRVAVTVGASGGFVLTALAAFDPGARVGVTAPGYSAYRNILGALDLEVVPIRVDASTRFVPTPERLDAAGPLDGLVVASPSNPTGTMLTPREFEAVVAWCRRRDVRLVSDEIYHGISYGSAETTAAALWDDAVVVQSFSKYFSMTGWRLGWLVLPEELVRPVERLAQNLFISPPTLSQLAGIAAFDCVDELDANVARYQERRRIVLDGLAQAGIDDVAPADGAFYVYARVDHLGDAAELCTRWLDELGITATPGTDFDPEEGHRWVRFSYSEATDQVAEAMRRLSSWVGRGRS